MNLELASIPLALVAGVFGVLSPCVWPLVPVVTSSAATTGRSGPLFLALGLSLSFAVYRHRAHPGARQYGAGPGAVPLSGRGVARRGGRGRKLLGGTLLALGVLVLTGVDKYLEALAVDLVPARVFTL
jgi:hypothetical protein